MLEAMRSASASWCALYSTTHDMGSIGIRFHSCTQHCVRSAPREQAILLDGKKAGCGSCGAKGNAAPASA